MNTYHPGDYRRQQIRPLLRWLNRAVIIFLIAGTWAVTYGLVVAGGW